MFNKTLIIMPPKATSASKSVKVPGKIPPWVASFSEFVKTKERKREVQQTVELYSEILTKHWDAFVEHNQSEQSERPAKKKRAVDPIKRMGVAMQGVAERVEEAKDNQELLRQYQEQMKGVVPEQIKSVLSAVVGGGNIGGDSTLDRSDVSRLIQQATDNLGVLSQATQRVLSYANVDRTDADQAVQSLTQVSQSIEDLKDSIGSV
jgi:methyl-accepting chemotaxis protein